MMVVPLLSPLGSWLVLEVYVQPERDRLDTVKVTLVTLDDKLVFEIVQIPLELVKHVNVPVAPFDHLPVTVVFAASCSLAKWTRIVTDAFHFVPDLLVDFKRSPT